MKVTLFHLFGVRLVMALLLGSTGCCAVPTMDEIDPSSYPGVLRPPSTLGPDLMWRQKVTARWGPDESASFEAVLQKRGNTLTLLGLNPMGQMGFALTFDGTEIDVQTRGGIKIPFPPRFILLDVQRAFWPWLGPHKGSEQSERFGAVAGERLSERYRDGRLVERTFRRLDNVPTGVIRIRYSGWREGRRGPTTVVLDNAWFGYVLTVETYAEEAL